MSRTTSRLLWLLPIAAALTGPVMVLWPAGEPAVVVAKAAPEPATGIATPPAEPARPAPAPTPRRAQRP